MLVPRNIILQKSMNMNHLNNPDFLIKTPFILNGILPVWSQVWGSQPTNYVITEPFFHQTSFGVWEAEYYFDAGSFGEEIYNDTYLQAQVKQLVFKITIPNSYYIENAQSYTLQQSGDSNVLTQTLNSGDTLHVVVKDKQAENILAIIGFFNPMMIGILLGVVIQQVYDGKRPVRRRPTKQR